jgi:hypothetical protein
MVQATPTLDALHALTRAHIGPGAPEALTHI